MEKLMSVLLACIMTVSFAGAADIKAAAPVSPIQLTTIDASQIPEGVIPMEFDSEEEALIFLQQIQKTLSSNSANTPIIFDTSSAQTRAANGTVTIDEKSFGVGSVKFMAHYGTSGSGKTGSITYFSPYTTLTGFTYGVVWNETDIGYTITASGKNVYAYCSGELEYYLLIDGLIKLGASEVNFGKTVYLVR